MKAILVFVVVLGVASMGWGQTYYKYVDKNGTVCFTDNPNNEEVRGVVHKDGAKVFKDKGKEGSTTAQDSKIGTKRVMIKGRWVDVPVYITKGGSRSYYDAHPEERARDIATQANKSYMDILRKLNENARTREQGYGRGMEGDHPSDRKRTYDYDLTPSPPDYDKYPISSPTESVPYIHGKPGTTYTIIGNTTLGSDLSTHTTIGNTTLGSDRSISTRSGNTTINSNLTTSTQIGNTLLNSDGTTVHRIGNTTFGSDGTRCRKIGNQAFCD